MLKATPETIAARDFGGMNALRERIPSLTLETIDAEWQLFLPQIVGLDAHSPRALAAVHGVVLKAALGSSFLRANQVLAVKYRNHCLKIVKKLCEARISAAITMPKELDGSLISDEERFAWRESLITLFVCSPVGRVAIDFYQSLASVYIAHGHLRIDDTVLTPGNPRLRISLLDAAVRFCNPGLRNTLVAHGHQAPDF